MNVTRGATVGVILVTSGLLCAAQSPTVPFKQIARDTELSARLGVPVNGTKISRTYELTGMPPSSPGVVDVPPEYKPPRIPSKGFFIVNGLHLGMAMLDVGMTQHCLANHHCREGNPMMPSSLGGQVAVDLGWVGTGALVSYHVKKEESGMWWFTPAIGIAAHAAGAASGFVNR